MTILQREKSSTPDAPVAATVPIPSASVTEPKNGKHKIFPPTEAGKDGVYAPVVYREEKAANSWMKFAEYSWLNDAVRTFIQKPGSTLDRHSDTSSSSNVITSKCGQSVTFGIDAVVGVDAVESATAFLWSRKRDSRAKDASAKSDLWLVTAAHVLPASVAALWRDDKDFVIKFNIHNTSATPSKTTLITATRDHVVPASWLPELDVFLICVSAAPGSMWPKSVGASPFSNIKALHSGILEERPVFTTLVTPTCVSQGSTVYTGALAMPKWLANPAGVAPPSSLWRHGMSRLPFFVSWVSILV